jgi:methionine sulfoxide reductase heme-binding subunit
VTGITSTTALWYASRATGVVTLVLLTAVVVLGMMVNRQGRLPGLPRFAVTGLHRNISLLSVIFLAIHVLTAIADPYVTIGLAATVIPFTSPYEPLWLGLGALSLDLIAALILTSLARARMGRRAWRGIHWLAYAAWPLAVVHSLGSSTDMRSGVMLGVLIGCVLAVCAALAWRLSRAARQIPRARRAAAALTQMPSPVPPRPATPGFAREPASRLVTAQKAARQ